MARGDCFIRGGSVVDGTGAAAFEADVRVHGGRIVEIAPGLAPGGEVEIDASGCVVTPGFIDTHTHYDATLFWDPRCDPIVQHGVTTLLIGNCALGMAPVKPSEVDDLGALFSYIEDIPKQVFETEVPWAWESYSDYAAHMRARPWGVNVASLVSHSLLRQYEIGKEAWERASTPEETSRIAKLADAAMKAGAFGISTSRFDRSPDNHLVPSYYADDTEFDAIFGAMAPYRGIMQMIPTMDDDKIMDDDLRRMGRFGARHGCPVFSNFIGQWPERAEVAPRLLDVAREIRAGGAEFRHMVSPRSIDIVLNFYQSMVMIYVPSWNAVLQASLSRDEKKEMLANPEWRAKARADWDAGSTPRDVAHLYQIIEVGKSENERWLGHTFGDLLAERPGHPSDVMADWALDNDLEAKFTYPLTNTDPEIVGQLLAAPENLISGSDAGAHIAMFDGAGDATLVLTRHVRDRGDMTLEAAVQRMTSDQASFLGLADRGVVAKGAIADLAIFKLDELEWCKSSVVSDIPGGFTRFRRPPGGYRYTLISGEVVQAYGKATDALPARFLGCEDRSAA